MRTLDSDVSTASVAVNGDSAGRAANATPPTPNFADWRRELQRLADEQELSWLVSGAREGHRPAYERGCSPAGELAELADLAQWRGCGCSGG